MNNNSTGFQTNKFYLHIIPLAAFLTFIATSAQYVFASRQRAIDCHTKAKSKLCLTFIFKVKLNIDDIFDLHFLGCLSQTNET